LFRVKLKVSTPGGTAYFSCGGHESEDIAKR